DDFRAELRTWIRHLHARNFDTIAAPRIVLVSPVAFEATFSAPARGGPDATVINARLRAYTDALLAVAAEEGIAAIDAFAPSLGWYAEDAAPLTVNGLHLNADGYARLGTFLAE